MAQSTDLSIPVPSEELMKLAKKFRNEALGATFKRSVECSSAKNYTTTQIMQVVSGLHSTFSHIKGMENVGHVIAQTLRPLIMIPMSVDERSAEIKQISTLFGVTPSEINIMSASDQKIRDQMSESVRQSTTKDVKDKDQNNYETIYYQLMVMAVYYPSKKTFDFYHAYVYCRDTSIWQWASSGSEKTRRMIALELEARVLLGDSIAQHSAGAVILRVDPEDKLFANQKAILNE